MSENTTLTAVKPQVRVLVVDDEPLMSAIVVKALASEKYEVEAVNDPVAAINYLREHRVDIVITDLMMGNHTGMEILDAAKAQQKDAVVILMTANPTVQNAVTALKSGAYDFLVKPFKLEVLKAAVARAISHQRIMRENFRLKEQVSFLQVANAPSDSFDLEKLFHLIASSCKAELSARAVGIIEIDSTQKTGGQTAFLGDSIYHDEVMSTTALSMFSDGHFRVLVTPDEVKADDGSKRLSITQPILIKGKLLGIINLVVFEKFGQISASQFDVLSVLASSAATAIENHRLYRDLHNSYLYAIRALANAIEARDQYTKGHTDRVCKLAELLAHELGWDGERIETLVNGCMLHDIGKIGVPDSILNKAGRLDESEVVLMRAHPEIGLRIIEGIKLFEPAAPYVLFHHENFDGSGYPAGLRGEEIPIEGRLLAVVDTFDAIMSDRPYRKGASMSHAVGELTRNKGTQFDPSIVDEFVRLAERKKDHIIALYRREKTAASAVLESTEMVPA